jgi:hypothetical protein
MFKSFLLASLGLGLLAATEDATPRHKPFDCGTDVQHADDHFLNTIKGLHEGNNIGVSRAQRAKRNELLARAKDNNTAISVDTVFHIVAKPENKDDITNDMPQAQVDALNKAYKDYGISFNLINVTWTQNDAWALGESSADTEMKKALRQGTYRTLNLYFQTDLSGGVLGRCSLPSNVANGKSDPTVYFSDGCNVNANTMPDGSMDGYNSGMTAVHETGHWMGLLHTLLTTRHLRRKAQMAVQRPQRSRLARTKRGVIRTTRFTTTWTTARIAVTKGSPSCKRRGCTTCTTCIAMGTERVSREWHLDRN